MSALLDYYEALLAKVIAETETKLQAGQLTASESLQVAEIINTLSEVTEALEEEDEETEDGEETEIEPAGY